MNACKAGILNTECGFGGKVCGWIEFDGFLNPVALLSVSVSPCSEDGPVEERPHRRRVSGVCGRGRGGPGAPLPV